MKKVRLTNRGFVMVETLIVAVFVATIFSIIYSNLYPIMAEYEKREVFDDVDGKYGTYWFKKIIQSEQVNFTPILEDINNNSYHKFDCNTDILPEYATTKSMCNGLIEKLQVARRDDTGNVTGTGAPCIYITKFRLTDFQEKAKNEVDTGIFSGSLPEYLNFLPEYKRIKSLNGADYRLIIEYHRTKDNNDYYAYSTIEVKKWDY